MFPAGAGIIRLAIYRATTLVFPAGAGIIRVNCVGLRRPKGRTARRKEQSSVSSRLSVLLQDPDELSVLRLCYRQPRGGFFYSLGGSLQGSFQRSLFG